MDLSKLERIEAVLFPGPDKNNILDDADENLDAALRDLRRDKADGVCIHTLERVLQQLISVRDIIEGK